MKKLILCLSFCSLLGLSVNAAAQSGPPPATGVYVSTVTKGDFIDTVEALGTLRANENVALASTVTELVTQINFTDGQRVVKGDVLVQMDNSEEVALLAEEQARVDEAQRQVDRFKPLIARGSVSELAFDQSISELSAAKARLRAVQSRIEQRKIVAPFDGVLGLRNTSVGTLLQPGSVITTIDDDSVMNLDFSVPEVFLQTLKPGLNITATTSAFPDKTYEGQVSSVAGRIDPNTRSIVVRARLENSDGSLKPGLLMRVVLKRNPRQALVIQEESVIADGRRNFVLVVVEKENATVAERREIQIGGRRKGEVEILEGVSEGELVINHGNLKAGDGSAVTVLAVEDNSETLLELMEQAKQKAQNTKPEASVLKQDGGAA